MFRWISASALSLVSLSIAVPAQHTFALGGDNFLYDGKPVQLISCEMHPARIPVEYWPHRIQMAKAMGCNTIAAYIFWNYHESTEGRFDFTTGNHDIAKFFKLVQAEGLHAIVRPGPYVCAEWDFGGIPPYLLKDPELRVRSMYPRYMQAAERYMAAFAKVIRPALITNGGPIVLLQVENEYGSYGNDRNYMMRLRDVWKANGIDIPFFTGDGPTPYMLEAGSLPGAAIGLDSGSDEKHWELARSINPGVPVFSSETYPGWLTHWGEQWQRPGIPGLLKEVEFLLSHKKSFNFYVAHGGTNFGFTAGANSGGKGYEPDVTSYDYDAPIDEQGNATPKYMALRDLIATKTGAKLPPVPAPIPTMTIPDITMHRLDSIWNLRTTPIDSVVPRTFETYGQNQGLAIYRTQLVGRKSGKLTITDLHDFAVVLVEGKFLGTIDRRLGEKSIDIPPPSPGGHANPILEILVEGMGHINFAQEIIDRKGITDRVTLNGMTLMNWQVFLEPLDDASIAAKRPVAFTIGGPSPYAQPGTFFWAEFDVTAPADTFIDMSGYKKGYVWVNGHNLGRYWEIGPQTRLYCPASWLKAGKNDIRVLDLLMNASQAVPIRGVERPY